MTDKNTHSLALPPWQLPLLGLREFPDELTAFEISYVFHFSPEEYEAIATRRGALHRLAAAVHLGFIKMTGCTLDAWEHIPPRVLRHLGDTLALPSPELTSLRALYRREQTLFEHQRWATEVLGFHAFSKRRQRLLMRQLRREARKAISLERLVQFAKRWLYEHRILIPAERRLRELAARAYRAAEQDLFRVITMTIPASVREQWHEQLRTQHDDQPVLEWLQQAPKRRSRTALQEALQKLTYLRELEIHRYLLDGICLERQRRYAQQLRRRRPARFHALKDPRRTLELVCFLRVTLLQVTDVVLTLGDLQITALRGQALGRVRTQELQVALEMRRTLATVWRLIVDPSLSDTQLRQQLLVLLPEEQVAFSSRAAAVRHYLSDDSRRSRPLLRQLLSLPLEGQENSPIMQAVAELRALQARGARTLPKDSQPPVAPRWRSLVNGSDRQRALRAFESATLLALQKALRNGAVWIEHSFSYRSRDQTLISTTEWHQQRRQHYQRLSLPLTPMDYLQRLSANIEAGLAALATAVRAGQVSIDEAGVHLSALAAEDEPSDLEQTRCQLFNQIGPVQFAELIVAMDRETRFSWTLLGRPPSSERELLTVYGALLAQGTELDAAGVALMMSDISEATIAEAMPLLEHDAALRQANETVVAYLRHHPIVQQWGDGHTASSDAMSLDTARHLWHARIDPRRRTHAVAVYSHLLDQWGVIYDQPIVLGQRQAGAAIEGVVRQSAAELVERLAVDTHGYTDFAMAMAKLLGFDLCPRLKDLRDRRLHIPRELGVPDELIAVVNQDVTLTQIEANWDQLVRIAASIDIGKTSAVLALQRFGSAARGDPFHKAGTGLGRLLRTLFLCDYFSNPVFRRELLRILNYGESLHSLQRAIHFGSISAARGRRRDELVAISGSLALLTNIVLAWTTHQMQHVFDQWEKDRHLHVPPEILRHIAPAHFRQINFRGQFHFPLQQYAHHLIPSSAGR